MAAEVLPCQGFSRQQMLEIFTKADVNQDGKVSGEEASAFFLETGVNKALLVRVWDIATNGAEGGLTPFQFSCALRLVSLLQTDVPFNNEFISKALDPTTGMHLPCPRIGARFLPAPERAVAPSRPRAPLQAPVAAEAHATAQATSAATTSPGNRSVVQASDSGGGLAAAQRGGSLSMAHLPLAGGRQASANGALPSAEDAPVLGPEIHRVAPFRVEVRTSPANSKVASKLTKLVAANGMLLTSPTQSGGLGFYVNADSKIARCVDENTKLARGEDCDAVPLCEAPASGLGKITAMHWDCFNGCLYTGHADGKVARWDVPANGREPVRTGHEWQAHKNGAVMAILMTPWGTLWTGSSVGSVRLWADAPSWAPLRAQYRSRELRQPSGQRAHVRVEHMLLSSSGQVVFVRGRSSINCWDAESGTFLGKLNCLGFEPSADPLDYEINRKTGLPVNEATGRAACNVLNDDLPPLGSWTMEEPAGTEVTNNYDRFLKGAATAGDFARRGVKSMITFGSSVVKQQSRGPAASLSSHSTLIESSWSETEDAPETSAAPSVGPVDLTCMCCTPDNHLWVGSKKGRVEKLTAWGRFVGFTSTGQGGVASLRAVGAQVWAGTHEGYVVVWDAATMRKEQCVLAHECAVVSIAQAGFLVYTLGSDGSIHGWNGIVVHKGVDREATDAHSIASRLLLETHALWHANHTKSINRVMLNVSVFTWNVNEGRPSKDSIDTLLAPVRADASTASAADVVVVGLQEVEMGTASVAMGAMKELMARGLAEQGNKNALWWEDMLRGALNPIDDAMSKGDLSLQGEWKRVGLRQLSGMLVIVFAHNRIAEHGFALGDDVWTTSIACGVGGFGGNKGAVAISFPLYRHRVVVLTSHFAAHQKAVDKRNADYATIVKGLTFSSDKSVYTSAPVRGDNYNDVGGYSAGSQSLEDSSGDLDHGKGLRSAHAVIWVGDFNYRVDLPRDIVDEFIRAGRLSELYKFDQASDQMERGLAFQGMREGPLTFNPTYKFDKGVRDPLAYDSSEKRRIPAWTDRIFFRGSVPFRNLSKAAQSSDASTDPGYSLQSPEQVVVKCVEYKSIPDVYDSDHKPVYARLSIDMPVTNVAQKRKHVNQILQRFLKQITPHLAPSLMIDSTHITLPLRASRQIVVTNTGAADCFFLIRGAGEDGCTPGTHVPWLCFNPVSAVVLQGGSCVIVVTAGPQAGETIDQAGGNSVQVRALLNRSSMGLEGTAVDNNDVVELQIVVEY